MIKLGDIVRHSDNKRLYVLSWFVPTGTRCPSWRYRVIGHPIKNGVVSSRERLLLLSKLIKVEHALI